MKYKQGDKVKIKSLDWYNKNKNEDGIIGCGNANFIPDMKIYCGDILTICDINEELSYYYVTGCQYTFKDEMIEGLVEEETKPKYEDEVNGEYYSTPKYLVRPSGYQFKDEHGNVINATKIVLEKKKKEYPKTFDKCCHILQTAFLCDVRLHKGKYYDIFYALAKLIVCRDVYWKLYGEEMGLEKPWEPDYTDPDQDRYAIVNFGGNIEKSKWDYAYSITFVFPTEEIRDAFYENFKSEIEICKELL